MGGMDCLNEARMEPTSSQVSTFCVNEILVSVSSSSLFSSMLLCVLFGFPRPLVFVWVEMSISFMGRALNTQLGHDLPLPCPQEMTTWNLVAVGTLTF